MLTRECPLFLQHVRWLPVDDFMLVECGNGAVYIWQLASGHLESTAASEVSVSTLSLSVSLCHIICLSSPLSHTRVCLTVCAQHSERVQEVEQASAGQLPAHAYGGQARQQA